MTEPRLVLEGIVKRYRDHLALDEVDLVVEEGTVLGLLGPNGAGKSTLVSITAGLVRPDSGTVRVCERDPRSGQARDRRLVGLAPQEIGVYPALTVEQNLRCFGEMCGLRSGAARRRAVELAEPFALVDLLERTAGQLSGGEQRRLHAAIALVHRPPLVLLDEPTAGADVPTRARLLEAVRTLTDDGTSVLYTTHLLTEIESLEADVAILEHGRIVAAGRVDDLVAQHADSLLVLEFDGGAPLPMGRGRVVDDRLCLPLRDPGLALAAVLASLGDDASRLRSVEVVRPSLEAAYLQLTGRPVPDAPAVGANGSPPDPDAPRTVEADRPSPPDRGAIRSPPDQIAPRTIANRPPPPDRGAIRSPPDQIAPETVAADRPPSPGGAGSPHPTPDGHVPSPPVPRRRGWRRRPVPRPTPDASSPPVPTTEARR